MSNLTEYAKRELQIAGLFDKDSDYNGMLGEAVLELIECFAKQGHSGASASMVTTLFHKVSQYFPLCPITGEDDEWIEVGPGVYQNKRCSAIFKENGKTRYNDGIVWIDEKGSEWGGTAVDKNDTTISSRVEIHFPFIPKTFYVKVKTIGKKKDDWDHFIKDEKEFGKAVEYFNRPQ